MVSYAATISDAFTCRGLLFRRAGQGGFGWHSADSGIVARVWLEDAGQRDRWGWSVTDSGSATPGFRQEHGRAASYDAAAREAAFWVERFGYIL